MEFRTEIKIEKANFEINHQEPILCIGSCFTEHIGKKLEQSWFQTFINPFGIVYNPNSIAKNFDYLIDNQVFEQNDLFYHNELWHSFLHHSHFSKMSVEETLKGINEHLLSARNFLTKTKRIIITLGSSNVFVLKEKNQVVANCHKIPNNAFEKRRLSVMEIVSDFDTIFQKLKLKIPDLEIILTISPVRHIREGLIENQRSKATLVLAAAALCEKFDFVSYFPSYEILMDDLRDYRFYESDLFHPNSQAIAYIWEKFRQTYFSQNTQKLINEILSVENALAHRPFNPNSEAHQKFLEIQKQKKAILDQKIKW